MLLRGFLDHALSRSAAFATDPELVVKYSGQIVDMQYEYPEALKAIQEEIERRLDVQFNHCMLNWYEDGGDYLGSVSVASSAHQSCHPRRDSLHWKASRQPRESVWQLSAWLPVATHPPL